MPYASYLSKNRYLTETSTLLVPRVVNPSLRPAVYAHGANGDGSIPASTQLGIIRNMVALAEAGLVVLAGDFGGLTPWGNDTSLTGIEAAWTWLQGSGLCATDKLIVTAGSMGFTIASRFAAAHPTQVAGMIGWIPAIDIEDIRTRDPISLRAGINTAWGLPAGSFIGGADQTPIPTRGKPLDSSNLSAVGSIPTHLFYSSGDTVTTSAAVDAYAAARPNVTKHLVSTSLDHSDAAILAADIPTVVGLAQGWA